MEQPLVLIADTDPATIEWLVGCLSEHCALALGRSQDEALAAVADGGVYAVIVGRRLADATGAELVESIGIRGVPVLRVVPESALALPGERWLQVGQPAADVVERVLAAARGSAAARTAGQRPRSADDAMRLRQVLDVARRLATKRDLTSAADLINGAVVELLAADRAHCLFHDGERGVVWRDGSGCDPDDEFETRRGLIGRAVLSARLQRVERLAEHSAAEVAVDDPEGDGSERVMAAPVVSGGEVHAVLVAARRGHREPFEAADEATMHTLAERIGPMLQQLALHIEAENVIEVERQQNERLFRREAVDHHTLRDRHGDVVRVSPLWVSWSYWLLVALLVAAGVYLFVGRVHSYSTGPAVVRAAGRSEVTARQSANVASVGVADGERVRSGQALVRLYSAEQRAELERIEREFETQLRNRMFDRTDTAANTAVRTLRTELDRARAQLEERIVRAPRDGLVSDLRVRPGERVNAGDVVLSIVDDSAEFVLVALLPGADSPRIKAGDPLRLELNGYRFAYQQLEVSDVSEGVIGPNEARRLLGPSVGDALSLSGGIAVVRARLRERSFVADDEVLPYLDGLLGTAEVRLRSERIITTLIPGLKRL